MSVALLLLFRICSEEVLCT
ncbi:hypothetical protein F383_31966 [Gossypium arboreum]|uniref:Uncharacterized protein n=1 Tax=Gossypium arboreum TaxID=29729 RepID=A0A0B0PLL2_GOSAR|nr:hypothetical protein F383_31966 [Gossypium arboreum]